jgi:hypothetical protein
MSTIDRFLIVFAVSSGIGGAVVLLFQFLGLRVKNASLPSEERDPQLGRKFALGVFLHVAVMLLLTGLTISAVDIATEMTTNLGGNTTPTSAFRGPGMPPPTTSTTTSKPFFNTQQRTAAGLMLSGVLHGVLFFMLLTFGTNARKYPAAGRAFVVNRLLVAGLILMSVTTSFCLFLFSEGDMKVDSFGPILGLAVVWGPTALGHFLWLVFAMKQDEAKKVKLAEVREAPPERDEPRGERRRRDEDDDDRRDERRRRRDDD